MTQNIRFSSNDRLNQKLAELDTHQLYKVLGNVFGSTTVQKLQPWDKDDINLIVSKIIQQVSKTVESHYLDNYIETASQR